MKRPALARLAVAIMCIAIARTPLAGIAASLWELEDGTPLMRAAWSGDMAKVKELIGRGADVNERTKEAKTTPLIFAAAAGRVEVVRLLLEHGAKPNVCGVDNMCPIWWAARSGSYQAVKALVDTGANVNAHPEASSLERPALHKAAAAGRLDLVRLLVDNGIEIDFSDFFMEQTALASAVANGRAEVAKFLIEHGASLGAATEVPYSDNLSALQLAKKKGYREVVEVVESALKSGKANLPRYSVESVMTKLYSDPDFDLSGQGQELTEFLQKQTQETLRLIRNTIFARKNYKFGDPALTEYFQKRFSDYKPATRKYEMSDVDMRNVQYMKEVEEYRAARDAAG